MNTLLNIIVRLFLRIFMPGIAKSLDEEGQFDFRDKGPGNGNLHPPSCIEVEDNGADITMICFAGMAVLYAAMPKFEFRKTLTSTGTPYNFIWVRDIHRSSYNLAPDGTPSGFEYYSNSIGEALKNMNSTRTVAIGASGGGAAAFAFSGVVPIDLIIAFNPAISLKTYSSSANRRRVILDWRKLLRAPRDYFEVMLVTLSTHYLWKQNCRLMGEENIPDVMECYLRKKPSARAVVIHSVNCLSDMAQLQFFKNKPRIRLYPVLSGRHNCMAQLKKRGELGILINEQIQVGLAVH
jgi:hypothetical protein